MFREITLSNLGSLNNGIAQAIVDHEIAKAVADLYDRGVEDGKPRKVTIELEMVMDGRDQAEAVVRAQAKLPARQSGKTVSSMRMKGKGQATLVFQDLNPESPDQASFDDVSGQPPAE